MGCSDSKADPPRRRQHEETRNSSALNRVLYGSRVAAKWKKVVAERNAAKSYHLTEKSLQANESTFRYRYDREENQMSRDKGVKNTSQRSQNKDVKNTSQRSQNKDVKNTSQRSQNKDKKKTSQRSQNKDKKNTSQKSQKKRM